MIEIRQAYLWFVVPGLIFFDLVTKFWARKALVPPVFELDLGPFLALQLAENPAASFGLLSFGDGPGRIVVPLLVTVGMATGVGVWLIRTKSEWRRLFVGLIFAGAASNIIDRMINGVVTDFLAYRWLGKPLFIGNVADVWITIGAIGAFGGILFARPGQLRAVEAAQGERE